MEYAAINSPSAAFVAGLVTSLHCAVMCGPLACMMAPARGDRADPQAVATVYHLSRLAAYAGLGAVAGALGRVPLSLLGGSGAARFLPWVLVIFFVGIALRLDRRIPPLAIFTRWRWQLQAAVRGRSRLAVAATLGAATPLLPCGPLYFLVTLAALAGSAVRGTEFMLAFGLGTLPLLWLAQANFGKLNRWLAPGTIARVQSSLALATALVLAWRLRSTLGFAGPDASAFLCTLP
jgi:sulfite exporter TauE/SafE